MTSVVNARRHVRRAAGDCESVIVLLQVAKAIVQRALPFHRIALRGRAMEDDNDARRLGSLEKAVNDSAGKAAVLCTSFVTLGTYLLIATGSVKHRDLFLDAPIKLPELGVALPVTGYFLVAPVLSDFSLLRSAAARRPEPKGFGLQSGSEPIRQTGG
jgi:hypothetical protein